VNQQEIVQTLQSRFPEAFLGSDLEALEPCLELKPEVWLDAARVLKGECGLDYLICLTAIDRGDGLEAVYNLENMGAERLGLAVRIKVSYDVPQIPSVESVWRTADWHEREAFDLMGLHFSGHPNLKRILCADDWEGHPLRKDYKSPDFYHGIKNNVV